MAMSGLKKCKKKITVSKILEKVVFDIKKRFGDPEIFFLVRNLEVFDRFLTVFEVSRRRTNRSMA